MLSITRLMSKLLHPGNSWKLLKKEAMRLFLLWYSSLGDQAGDEVQREGPLERFESPVGAMQMRLEGTAVVVN